MKWLKELVVIVTMVFYNYSLVAQVHIFQKPRLYETWVSLNNKPATLKGILYEVHDSSVTVSFSKLRHDYSTGNFKVSEININSIDKIYTRRINNITKGALIGAATGSIIVIVAFSGEKTGLTFGQEFYFFGIPFAAIGASIGALAGSFRVRIPIHGSLEYFNKNKSRLQHYSYLTEKVDAENSPGLTYEYSSFVGMLTGPSFPLGNFASKSADNEFAGYAKSGYSGNTLNLGFRFADNIGVSALLFYNQYDIEKSGSEMWWGWVGFMAGPMYSVPVRNKLIVDVKPRIGFSDESINVDGVETRRSGLGINFSSALRYNFARRWCLLAETSYTGCSRKTYQIGNVKLQSLNLDFGLAYRFR
jgi:hypothetical protein